MNETQNLDIFNNKGKTYELFKSYYGREILCVDSVEQKACFVEFAKKHKTLMIKPIDGTGGKNVSKIYIENDNVEKIFDEVFSDGGFVAEEVIVSSKEMAKFHPKSLNTVRVPTIISKGKVEVFGPFIRLGTGESIVDNAFSGGIFACVDEKTGVVVSKACNKKGQYFIKHPDTDEMIVGFQLPDWDEAIALVSKLAQVVKGNRYTGWDLAHKIRVG